jgi:hypothetical protein
MYVPDLLGPALGRRKQYRRSRVLHAVWPASDQGVCLPCEKRKLLAGVDDDDDLNTPGRLEPVLPDPASELNPPVFVCGCERDVLLSRSPGLLAGPSAPTRLEVIEKFGKCIASNG